MNHFTLASLALLLSTGFNFACTKNLQAREPGEAGRPAKIMMTASFKTVGDLPRCDAGTEQVSAYVSERDVFVQCRSFFWRDVKPGGTPGQFAARTAVRFNEWTDTSTKLRWSLPKQAEVGLASVSPGICSQGWKLPTGEELVRASSNGLFEGLKARGGIAFDKAWTASLDTITGVSKGSLASVLPKADGKNPTETAGVYCVASVL